MAESHTCPLAAVERRANDAWLLFLEAEKHYFNPDRFRLNLNSCITTLRSVTFVLQKNKRDLDEFDSWYGRWQTQMRASPVLKWLVDSRNKIEKQGDLETNSKARIGIYDSWLQPPLIELDVPPSTKTAELAQILARVVPAPFRSDGNILRVERRWVDSEMKDRELLNLISEGYEAIAAVIADAHSHLHCPCDCDWLTRYKNNGTDNEIETSGNDKVVWLSLADFSPVELDLQAISVSRSEAEHVAHSRYGFDEPVLTGLKNAKDLADHAKAWFELAKAMLKRDGHHRPIALLRLSNTIEVVEVQMETRAQKSLALRMVADLTIKKKASAVFFVNEVWLAAFDPMHPERYAKDAPDRIEALALHAIDRVGCSCNCLTVFKNRDGIVEFVGADKYDEQPAAILQPFRDAWSSTLPG